MMKKKMFSAAVALVMAVSLVLVPDGAAVFNSGAKDFVTTTKAEVTGDWEYVINRNGTVTIKEYIGDSSSISIAIPGAIDGRKVADVSGSDFYSYQQDGLVLSKVTRVFGNVRFLTFPSSVTYVGELVIGKSIETVTFESQAPPTFSPYVFEEGCPKTIYVPIGTESAYEKVLSKVLDTHVQIISIKSTTAFIIIGAGTLIGIVALIIATIIIRKKKKPQP